MSDANRFLQVLKDCYCSNYTCDLNHIFEMWLIGESLGPISLEFLGIIYKTKAIKLINVWYWLVNNVPESRNVREQLKLYKAMTRNNCKKKMLQDWKERTALIIEMYKDPAVTASEMYDVMCCSMYPNEV